MRGPRFRRGRAAALAVVIGALVAAGCASDDTEDGGTTGGGNGGTNPLAPATTVAAGGATTTTELPPQPGGTLVMTTGAETRGLDPTAVPGASALGGEPPRMFAIYDALMLTDSSTGEVKPHLAESLTTDDRVVWTLKLRSGVTFTDGTTYDAEAVKFNWERHADPETNSPAINLLRTMTEIEVVDDLTLRVTLAAENGQFPRAVAANLSWIGSPTAIEAKGNQFGNEPVGAGPFTLREWSRDSRMVLVKNPTYWNAPKPYIDELIIRVLPDPVQAINSVNNNEADISLVSQLAQQKQAADMGLALHPIPGIGVQGLNFNMQRAPFDDARMRKAILLAVDYNQLNQVTTDGIGDPVASWFPDTSVFYDDSVRFPGIDLAAAQALVDEYVADVGQNVSFTVTTSDAGFNPRMNEFLVAAFNRLDKVTASTAIMPQNQSTSELRNRNYDMISYAYLGVDPEPQYYESFHSQGTRNFSGYENPAVDEALLAARNSDDLDVRREEYLKVQQALLDDGAPMLVTARSRSAMVAKPDRVQAVSFFEDGGLRFDEVWIKQ